MPGIRIALFFTLVTSLCAANFPEPTAAGLIKQWQEHSITGHCPVLEPSPTEMETFKQAVVAAGFLTVSFGGGEPIEAEPGKAPMVARPCVMILCPDAVGVPYVLHDESAFNRLYEPSKHKGRSCFASKAR